MIIPCFAPVPIATVIAVGVAKPKAHGQAIKRIAIVGKILSLKDACKNAKYMINVIKLVIRTAGTKTEEILSAKD